MGGLRELSLLLTIEFIELQTLYKITQASTVVLFDMI